MEIVKIKISKELLQILVDSDAIKTEDFELVSVDVVGYDYSNNEAWKIQRDKSNKEYKKLKKLEYEIRNQNK